MRIMKGSLGDRRKCRPPSALSPPMPRPIVYAYLMPIDRVTMTATLLMHGIAQSSTFQHPDTESLQARQHLRAEII